VDVSCSTSAVAVALANYESNKLSGIHTSEITPLFFVNDVIRNITQIVQNQTKLKSP
jgi:hypothetical protein